MDRPANLSATYRLTAKLLALVCHPGCHLFHLVLRSYLACCCRRYRDEQTNFIATGRSNDVRSPGIACLCLESPSIPIEHQLPPLVNKADLLSSTEEAELLAKLDEISERQYCDVAIVRSGFPRG